MQRRVQKNMITALPVHAEAHRLLGADLSAVPGLKHLQNQAKVLNLTLVPIQ